MARILVIDDEAGIRSLIDQVLRGAGHEAMLAADGEQGLRLHRASPARLVITDIFMPGKEGLETICAFNEEFPNVPVIAMSGRPDLGNVLQVAQRLSAVRTLAKPFHPHELLALVEDVLQTHSPGPAQGED